jgi:hypothetical protein
MTAFAVAVDALFADANLGRDATYEPADGDPFPVRVIARRADAITEFGEARLWSETTRFDVRTSQTAEPRPGDKIVIDGTAYIVHAQQPERGRGAADDQRRRLPDSRAPLRRQLRLRHVRERGP